VRRALQLALEQDLGRETGVIYGNLGGVVWSYEGPQAALDVMGEAIAFCERRGITELVLQTRSAIPTALAELGRTEQALAEAGPIADQIEAAGDMSYVATRALHLQLLAETGASEQAPVPEELAEAARSTGIPGFMVLAVSAAAQILLARGQGEQARALLLELDRLALSRNTDYSSVLPSLLRVALALDDDALAGRLAAGVEPADPQSHHAVLATKAQLAEAAGRHADAAQFYREAVERWREYGNVPERAYALLGQGRCLVALGDPKAEAPLREARELFASMGYRPALAETERLLADAVARTA
jgi:tetratricopeptide (TPR) repeat protein